MIYLVSGQSQLINSDNYAIISVSESIQRLESMDIIALDIETTGLDCHNDRMFLLQIGDNEDQFVIDCDTINPLLYKKVIESKLIIGHNIKFDLKFLYKKGIVPTNVYDTYIVEVVLYCGLPDIRFSLDQLVKRYLGIELDKSVRKTITRGIIDTSVIVYGAKDVEYLLYIKDKQEKELNSKDLNKVSALENRFVPCLAYIEYCGFKLDSEKWKEKMKSDQNILKEAKDNLDNWVLNNNLPKYIDPQLSLFDPIRCKINWASPKQVIDLFTDLGIDCTTYDKGKLKQSVEAGIIEKQTNKSPIVPLYLSYKKAEKVVSTYGESFLKQINKSTGRIHSSFKQIMDTGRLSSGGKDRATGENYVNFQNIPSDPFTRSCFVSEKGNTLVISDYSGQEQIVLANKALDPNILKFYDDGLGDMHSFVASKMYPELEGLTLEEIKSKHKDKRQRAKIAGFAINYGGVGQTIADQLNMSVEEGNSVYNAYFTAFPHLKDYFEEEKKRSLNTGYVLISDFTKRKSYIYGFDRFRELSNMMNREFWSEYKMEKPLNSPRYKEMKKLVSEYFLIKGRIERKSLNFPIQGSSAEITKMSCIFIFDYIIKNKLFNIVKFVNTVHDENVLECPENMANNIAQVVKDCMFRAGTYYCKRVPLKAEPEISKFWKK